MPNNIQAAAERYRTHLEAKKTVMHEGCFYRDNKVSIEDDQVVLATAAATLIPQLVVALKAARQTIGLLRNDWQVIGIESELEYIDAAIAAGEGRDANRS
jgi:hypothetical protein